MINDIPYKLGELFASLNNAAYYRHGIVSQTEICKVEFPLFHALIPHEHFEKSEHLILGG
jgi:hypothetical protein